MCIAYQLYACNNYIPFHPGTLGWEGQWDYTMHSGTLSTCLGWSLPSQDSGMGGTVGLHHAQWDT